jgi:AcrR family transcriptional regulator
MDEHEPTALTAGVRARRPRADSERNRSQILAAAGQHFAQWGVGASLETIARDAGVGSATLYRHFPTRDDLLAGLVELRSGHVHSEIERIRQLEDTGEALDCWLEAVEEFFSVYEGLPAPVRTALTGEQTLLGVTCTGFIDETAHFLQAAQNDGLARADVRPRDLFLMTLALSWVRGSSMTDDPSPENLRALVRAGYRP